MMYPHLKTYMIFEIILITKMSIAHIKQNVNRYNRKISTRIKEYRNAI